MEEPICLQFVCNGIFHSRNTPKRLSLTNMSFDGEFDLFVYQYEGIKNILIFEPNP